MKKLYKKEACKLLRDSMGTKIPKRTLSRTLKKKIIIEKLKELNINIRIK